MSTNFFERQADARRNTTRLVVLFVVAVILIVGVTSTATYFGAKALGESKTRLLAPNAALTVGLLTLAMIVIGTVFKVIGLRMGGGMSVAVSVGGVQLSPEMKGLHEQRVLNVVEEMAIASGTPVPPVYLLEEDSINAFAAGYSPSDAVIGVTRGAVENLTRDQLQGVIAHEFSHILNGDMRMNIRLIGILNGILVLHIAGSMLLRSLQYTGRSRRSNDSGNSSGQAVLLILAVGAALFAIGYIGHFIGGLIKAAVSRQREYLADASAIQFTRNPQGIGGALKAIGSIAHGAKIAHPGAEIASHMYFASGFAAGLSNLTATHPPLAKRILEIDPSWDGQYPPIDVLKAAGSRTVENAAGFVGGTGPNVEVPVAEVRDTMEHIGAPEQQHRDYAVQLIADLPEVLVSAAHEAYSARAVVFALLLDKDPQVRKRQLDGVGTVCKAPLVNLSEELWRYTGQLPDQARLPLMDMTLPALRMMSTPQYISFMRAFAALADADNEYSIFEWALAQILIRHLKPQFVTIKPVRIRHRNFKGLEQDISVLLSVMSRVGHTEEWIEPSFAQGKASLPNTNVRLLPESECSLKSLHNAVKELGTATAKIRGRVIDACAHTVAADGHVCVSEAEMLRGIADLVDCPVPPWIHTIKG